MSFISGEFVVFVAILFVLYFSTYYVAPKFQWTVLLVASWVFYAFASIKYTAFLMFSTMATWLFPLLYAKVGKKKKKCLAAVCIVLNIGILFILKYSAFLTDLMGLRPISGLVLPLGISFYTFQSVGYCIDVYRGKTEPERNFFRYALFVAYFPQICEGPIGRYGRLVPQLTAAHRFEYGEFSEGLSRVVTGLFKKLFVANTLSKFVDAVYASASTSSGLILCAAAVMYTFQIYADFSGYIDISLGISQSLGIRLDENFRAPDFAVSVNDFWKRWHISLTSWFRDYLYIPLGGNRKGTARKYLNKMIVFLVSGLWHGADFSFICWGALHGVCVVIEELTLPARTRIAKRLRINRESSLHTLLSMAGTFLFVTAAWILFRADNMNVAATIFRRIFTAFLYDGWTGGFMEMFDIHYFITAAIGIIMLLAIERIEIKRPLSAWLTDKPIVVKWPIIYALMLCIAYILITSNVRASDAANFIYFQF